MNFINRVPQRICIDIQLTHFTTPFFRQFSLNLNNKVPTKYTIYKRHPMPHAALMCVCHLQNISSLRLISRKCYVLFIVRLLLYYLWRTDHTKSIIMAIWYRRIDSIATVPTEPYILDAENEHFIFMIRRQAILLKIYESQRYMKVRCPYICNMYIVITFRQYIQYIQSPNDAIQSSIYQYIISILIISLLLPANDNGRLA